VERREICSHIYLRGERRGEEERERREDERGEGERRAGDLPGERKKPIWGAEQVRSQLNNIVTVLNIS
jgi:hypothetical protein